MIALYLDEIKDVLSSYEWIRLVETIRCDFEENDLKRILFYRFRVYLSDSGQLEMVGREDWCQILGREDWCQEKIGGEDWCQILNSE